MFKTMLPGRLRQLVCIPLSSHVLLDGIKSKSINVSKSVTGNNDQNYRQFVRIPLSFHGVLYGIKSKNIMCP